MKAALLSLAAIFVVLWMFWTALLWAYDRGHATGMAQAKLNQPSQCFAWWFGENTKQHAHELKQFCKDAK